MSLCIHVMELTSPLLMPPKIKMVGLRVRVSLEIMGMNPITCLSMTSLSSEMRLPPPPHRCKPHRRPHTVHQISLPPLQQQRLPARLVSKWHFCCCPHLAVPLLVPMSRLLNFCPLSRATPQLPRVPSLAPPISPRFPLHQSVPLLLLLAPLLFPLP